MEKKIIFLNEYITNKNYYPTVKYKDHDKKFLKKI